MKMSKGFLSILATCTCATGVAAPPAKPPPTPPDVDIAYLSISNNSWTGWPPAAIRGIDVGAAGALITDVELWIAEIEYVASAGAEQATVTRLWHSAAGVTVFPAWAPVSEGTACDRLAFTRSSVVWLHDVPRDGFSGIDCAIGTLTAIGGKAVAALDWR